MSRRLNSSYYGGRGVRDAVIAVALVLLSPIVLQAAALADVSAVTVIAVPGSPVTIGQDHAISTTVTPDTATLANVAANVPVPNTTAGETVTRYVSADSAGTSGIVDMTTLATEIERVRYTSLSAAGVQTMQLDYEIANAGANGWVVQLEDNNAQRSSFAVAAGFCSSNCNLLTTIASSIVGLGCGAAGIITTVPTAGAGPFVILAGCTTASGTAGYVVGANCSQATFCTPRITQNYFSCAPLGPGCHSSGYVTASPGLSNPGSLTNNTIYSYYNSPLLYFRTGINTTGGSYTSTYEISNSNGVYFYGFSSDFTIHQFACPANTDVTAQVRIENGTSNTLAYHLAPGCV